MPAKDNSFIQYHQKPKIKPFFFFSFFLQLFSSHRVKTNHCTYARSVESNKLKLKRINTTDWITVTVVVVVSEVQSFGTWSAWENQSPHRKPFSYSLSRSWR
ncbi:hypothetical protein V8G54_024158 [Vigna mungo]|uniref:Uncharacterized protein n=1 Tax=Vigna mungo TaxID=3915 RepID=A0AAQ3N6C2_VIGMU